MLKRIAFCVITLLLALSIQAQDKDKIIIKWVDQPDDWFRSDEGQKIISNVVSWQNTNGGWYKTYDTTVARPSEVKLPDSPLAPPSDKASAWASVSTIDNDATFTDCRVLARAVRVTDRADAKESFYKGINYLLEAQYPNGGWPQRFPLQKNYGRHITFNDGAMIGVVTLMRDAASGAGDFSFVDEDHRAKCKTAYEKGIDAILKTQITVNGKLTGWCQQHDAESLAPTTARTYELPSISSTESAGILSVLMEIPNPDERVKAAINGAVTFYESVKMTGKRYEKLTGPQYEQGFERRLIDDPAAPPYWARFYSLDTLQPMFVDRDGSLHKTVDELSYERRAGYAWFSTAPNSVLKKYAKWKSQ